MSRKIFVFHILLSTFLTLSICTQTAGQESTGLIFLEESEYLSLPEAAPSYRGNPPKAFDLSNNLPTPGSQGQLGSCVGWAVCYGLKSYQEQVERTWGLKSSDTLFSPSFLFNMVKKPGPEAGANFEDALNFLQNVGTVPLSMFPYSEHDYITRPNQNLMNAASEYRIHSWTRVSPKYIGEIKGHLLNEYPVLVGCMVGGEFKSHVNGPKKRSPFIQAGFDPNTGGHAMLVVGYSDDTRAFKLLNSWGTDRGDNGYVWIDYQTFVGITREAFITQDMIDQSPEVIISKTDILKNYKIDFYSLPEQYESVYKIAQNFLANSEARVVEVTTRPEAFFREAVFTPVGPEIRFEAGVEDQQAKEVWKILNKLYPDLGFKVVPVINSGGDTTNYISVMFAKRTNF